MDIKTEAAGDGEINYRHYFMPSTGMFGCVMLRKKVASDKIVITEFNANFLRRITYKGWQKVPTSERKQETHQQMRERT